MRPDGAVVHVLARTACWPISKRRSICWPKLWISSPT
jgi:hypothetical protein